ncbi:putative transcriptional regulatory protein [Lasiodiplodia hormozganensis]|uniref:Transcriptional regulatory protein n=1 Tax=Lasiodiplodia hormozganensis TaxID=869390 RepID=A0AA39YWV8_9PEZI|nr:putative transcriptional regulatory protein [Lasiodiplodia hormozganensis]
MDLNGQNAASAPQTQQTPPLPLVPEPKKHAACDECRLRKLKCSGNRPACDRCARENLLPCVYSLQKQMGRPRKKRRRSADDETNSDLMTNGAGIHGGMMMMRQGQEFVVNGGVNEVVGWSDGDHHRPREERNGGGNGTGVNCGIEGMGFGGFEGFGFGEMVNGETSGEGAGGPHATSGGGTFELDPNFSLDSLLTGDLADVMGGNGSSVGGFNELQQEDRVASVASHSSQNGHSLQNTPSVAHHDSSIQQPPFLAPSPGLPCACLSTIYLTISSLHSLSSHNFPFCLPSLHSALVTARNVLQCPTCPHSMATATLNIHMLISLLMTVIDAVQKLLQDIDAEAARVDAAGTTKQFVLADASAPLHMHTGTANCPARFGMELSGVEWRELARKVVKAQVVGSSSSSSSSSEAEGGQQGGAAVDCTIYGVLAAFVRRQNGWHDDPAMIEVRKKAMGGGGAPVEKMEELGQMRLCVQNVEHVVERMKLLDI